MKNIISFTVCNFNYLDKALALAESYKAVTKKELLIVIIDKPDELGDLPGEILFLDEFDVPEVEHLAFKYDIIEFSTAVKPFITMNLLQKYEKVIFFDPDTYILNSIEPIIDELEDCDVLLTPHYLEPQPANMNESDLAMMRFGSFNLGFYAIRRTAESFRFLEWWWDRTKSLNYMESQFGLSTDQKWISIAVCFFSGIKISRNKCLNVAPWNSFERRLALIDDVYCVDGKPVIFYHFSNFNFDDPDYKNKRTSIETNDTDDVLVKLSYEYHNHCCKFQGFERSYIYDFDDAGNYISPTYRRAYAAIHDLIDPQKTPFVNDKLRSFAKRAGLLQKSNTKFELVGYRSHTAESVSMRIIDLFLRLLLRLVGPNKYFVFHRYLLSKTLFWRDLKFWEKQL